MSPGGIKLTLIETLTLGAGLLSTISLIAGAVYVRGQKDRDITSLKADVLSIKNNLEKQTGRDTETARKEGAADVRSKQFDDMIKDFRELRDTVIKFAQQVTDHERECLSRQNMHRERFDKIDRNIAHLEASIRNVALGEADRIRDVNPNTRGRQR